MSEVTLQISIAGKNYPLSVKASEEAAIRKAEAQLEEAVSMSKNKMLLSCSKNGVMI